MIFNYRLVFINLKLCLKYITIIFVKFFFFKYTFFSIINYKYILKYQLEKSYNF